MAYVRRTALGREVPIEDWRAYHRDTLLRVLFDHHSLSEPDLGLPRSSLVSVTGLSGEQVDEILEQLKAEALVATPGARVKISDPGVHHVLLRLSVLETG